MVHRHCDLTIMGNMWQGKALDLVSGITRMMLLREKSGLLLCKVGNSHPWRGYLAVMKTLLGEKGRRHLPPCPCASTYSYHVSGRFLT